MTAQRIRGVRFEPDTRSGPSWLLNYHWQYPQVHTELEQLKDKTNLTHLVVLLSAGFELHYPVPLAGQLDNLHNFLLDAMSFGFKVILYVGSPTVISEQRAILYGTQHGHHVSGHTTGETVNGHYLWWIPPRSGMDHVEVSAQWYAAVASLANDVATTVEHIVVSGDYRVPYACETNLLWEGNPHREIVADYLNAQAAAIRAAAPGMRVGVGLTNSTWPGMVDVYDQAKFARDNLGGLDVYDSSVHWPAVDVATLRTILPPDKLVIADMLMNTGTTQYGVVGHFVTRAELLGLRGYWIWEYRDRTRGGLREREVNGGKWNEKLCALLRADCMED